MGESVACTPDAITLGRLYSNVRIAETVLQVYRCPSAGLPEHQVDHSIDGWWVMRRVPASYLGVVSGLEIQQSPSCRLRNRKEPTGLSGVSKLSRRRRRDGWRPATSPANEKATRITFGKITDGTSKTALVGEALHDVDTQDAKGSSRPRLARVTAKTTGGQAATTSTRTPTFSTPPKCLVQLPCHQRAKRPGPEPGACAPVPIRLSATRCSSRSAVRTLVSRRWCFATATSRRCKKTSTPLSGAITAPVQARR